MSERKYVDLRFPLSRDGWAVLTYPEAMTEKEWDMLHSTLELWRACLVTAPAEPTGGEEQ